MNTTVSFHQYCFGVTLLVISTLIATHGSASAEESLSLEEMRKICLSLECEVHGCAFELVEVPIKYGLPAPDRKTNTAKEYRKKYLEVKERFFPNIAPPSSSIGCVVPTDRFSHSCACPACLRALEAWKACCGPGRHESCEPSIVQEKTCELIAAAEELWKLGAMEYFSEITANLMTYLSRCDRFHEELAHYEGEPPCKNLPNNSFQRTLTPAGFGPLNSKR